MTKQESAVVMAYTDFAMLKGDDLHYFYNYLSGIIGRPVYIQEIPKVTELYHDTTIKNDFIKLCENAKEVAEWRN